jgi:DNA-binding response OmpR family regulator
MKPEADESAGAVLIVAPIGKDAALGAEVLRRAGIASKVCASIADAAAALNAETSALLLGDEALDRNQLPGLLSALERQPTWSDLPIIILTSSGASDRISVQVVEIFGPSAT